MTVFYPSLVSEEVETCPHCGGKLLKLYRFNSPEAVAKYSRIPGTIEEVLEGAAQVETYMKCADCGRESLDLSHVSD